MNAVMTTPIAAEHGPISRPAQPGAKDARSNEAQAPASIRVAQSSATEARLAVTELHAGLAQQNTALVLFFCSSQYDLAEVTADLKRLFPGVPLAGCTTAGEIGPLGCGHHGISGASFPAASFTAVVGHMDHLAHMHLDEPQAQVQALLQRLEAAEPGASVENTFALLLIDGLCRREELVAHALQSALGKRMLVGGSAGDDLAFGRTQVYFDGHFETDAAVIVLISSRVPFKVFKTQHFVSAQDRLVVTGADTARRVVTEINGLPAAQEYARLIGANVDDLDPSRFAGSPIVVLIDGTDYVRSIQKANPDGSLTFYCAIDEGLVLRVAHGTDLVSNLEQAFAKIREELGPPQAVLAFDCILRSLEITQKGLQDRVGHLFRDHHTAGFSTYGEQFQGVHVNQTLTGVAFGAAPEMPDA